MSATATFASNTTSMGGPAVVDETASLVMDMQHLRDCEQQLWALAFCGVTGVSLFARFLDETESRRRDGRNRSRNSNVLCCIFMFAVAQIYFSIIVLQAGRASPSQVFDVLVGRAALSPLEEFQAKLVHAMMLAYMVADVGGRVAFGHLHGKTAFVVHHLACVVGLVCSLVFRQSGMFGAAVGLSEFSTPVVAVLEIAIADDMPQLKLCAGLVLNVLFPVRVALFTAFLYLWAVEHFESPFLNAKHESFEVNVAAMLAVFTLTALQWKWWFALVSETLATLFSKKTKKA